MTTTQILKLDDSRNTGRVRADERLAGNRYVINQGKVKSKPRDERARRLEEIAI
jgi:hypothetical protein